MEISATSTWFVTDVVIDRVLENGMLKSCKESYVAEAFNPTEAEQIVTAKIADEAQGEFSVVSVKKTKFSQIEFGSSERWFSAKVCYSTTDEKTGKVKRTTNAWLVNVDNIKEACAKTHSILKDSVVDCEVVSLVETKFLDVYKHN